MRRCSKARSRPSKTTTLMCRLASKSVCCRLPSITKNLKPRFGRELRNGQQTAVAELLKVHKSVDLRFAEGPQCTDQSAAHPRDAEMANFRLSKTQG
jgi:hypothetical protein